MLRGLFYVQTLHLGPCSVPGRYIAVGRSSGVAVKRGSTVIRIGALKFL